MSPAFSTETRAVDVISKQIKLLSGSASVTEYMDEKVDSGNVLKRSFCRHCGSSLFLENTTMQQTKDVIVIMTGGLDGPKGDYTPKREFYEHNR